MCGCAERQAVIIAAVRSGDVTELRAAAAFVVETTAQDVANAARAAAQFAGARMATRLGIGRR